MSTAPKSYITPEEYLEAERRAPFRSEYFAGEVFAVAGASEAHVLLTRNLILNLQPQLPHCLVMSNDMRVRVSPAGLYTYPDVVIVCGRREYLDDKKDTLLNPVVIAEVLSPSTEAYDRGVKFDQYQSVVSLRQYVLVSSDRAHVDIFTRLPDGGWVLRPVHGLHDRLELFDGTCTVALEDLYRQVDISR